jgi:hypothetical protein
MPIKVVIFRVHIPVSVELHAESQNRQNQNCKNFKPPHAKSSCKEQVCAISMQLIGAAPLVVLLRIHVFAKKQNRLSSGSSSLAA